MTLLEIYKYEIDGISEERTREFYLEEGRRLVRNERTITYTELEYVKRQSQEQLLQ